MTKKTTKKELDAWWHSLTEKQKRIIRWEA